MPAPLFGRLDEIDRRVARAPALLVGAGYDGTLTPLVDEPNEARLSPAAHATLRALARREDVTLAVVSGRLRADLQARVDVPGAFYIGNHGLEISGPGALFVEPTAAGSQDEVKALAAQLDAKLRHVAGVWVEDKALTLCVHYRRAAPEEGEEVRRLVHAALACASYPFQLTVGEKAYEIRPRVYWNKGSAVHWVREHSGKPEGLAIYLGDDATDEDAFAALPDGITVRVGGAAETVAQYALKGPAQVLDFLDWLKDRSTGR